MIHWLKEEEFIRKFDTLYRPHKLFLTESLFIKVTLQELQNEIGDPASPDLDEEDGLGPRQIWYGAAGDFLFLLTEFSWSPIPGTMVSSRANRAAEEQYCWSFIKQLTSLPRLLWSRICWIRSDTDQVSASLFCLDQDGIVREVYRAESRDEAVELSSFLKDQGAEHDYFIAEPDDLNSYWLIVRNQPNEPGGIFARYPLRSSAEEVARRMSLTDDAIYKVKESGAENGPTFRRGKRSNSSDEQIA